MVVSERVCWSRVHGLWTIERVEEEEEMSLDVVGVVEDVVAAAKSVGGPGFDGMNAMDRNKCSDLK